MSDAKSPVATRDDVEEIVGRVVGEIIGDALQLISGRFDKVERKLDEHSALHRDHAAHFDVIDASLNRIENKLDATIDRVDDHSTQLKLLKARTA